MREIAAPGFAEKVLRTMDSDMEQAAGCDQFIGAAVVLTDGMASGQVC